MDKRKELEDFILQRMDDLELNPSSLSVKAGCKVDTIRNFLRGSSTHMRSDNYEKIMKIIRPDKTSVVGAVGAGEEITNYDNTKGAALEEVTRPLGDDMPLDIVAVRVKGDSMEPQLEEGWLLFYSRTCDGVPSDCIGELCVVKLENEGLLVKKVRQGSKPGLYHLISKNTANEPMVDQKLQWASRVLDIRPR